MEGEDDISLGCHACSHLLNNSYCLAHKQSLSNRAILFSHFLELMPHQDRNLEKELFWSQKKGKAA